MLEIITSGGLEQAFRTMGRGAPEDEVSAMITAFGCPGDPETTEPIVERYALAWG